MAADNPKHKKWNLVLFIAYLILLFYFLFFSEAMGRGVSEPQFRYNLTLFREIGRFIDLRNGLDWKARFLNVFGNVLAFMPFGFFLPKLSSGCRNLFLTVFLSFELSLCVEILQLVFKLGCFDVDDLLLNTIGGFLGYLVAILFVGRKKRSRKKE